MRHQPVRACLATARPAPQRRWRRRDLWRAPAAITTRENERRNEDCTTPDANFGRRLFLRLQPLTLRLDPRLLLGRLPASASAFLASAGALRASTQLEAQPAPALQWSEPPQPMMHHRVRRPRVRALFERISLPPRRDRLAPPPLRYGSAFAHLALGNATTHDALGYYFASSLLALCLHGCDCLGRCGGIRAGLLLLAPLDEKTSIAFHHPHQ